METSALLLTLAFVLPVHTATPAPTSEVLKRYVEAFNQNDTERVETTIPNNAAAAWMQKNIPRFECPEPTLEEIYYFRWWTYRKHLQQTPDGFVVTEFLPKVPWSANYNTISCAAGHHFYEGRWIHDPRYMEDYATFWFRGGGAPRHYSFWAADALWANYLVDGRAAPVLALLPDLCANFVAWEKSNRDANGLFWQIDDRDGMEVSVGGSGYRATINSYMYGDAMALARLSDLAGNAANATVYREKAATIKHLVQEKLWDADAKFFKVLPRGENSKLADVRELHGYTPWYFNLPDSPYTVAWKQIADPQGFLAPYGPTTAEQRHPRFALSYQGHECQWNGPGWPYSTAVTLTALANLLNRPEPLTAVTKADYFTLLKTYAISHHLRRDDGKVVPWIDENLNPLTGDWISRTRLKAWKDGAWDVGKGGIERGKDYNHSTFCDLVITGLVGLRPRPDSQVEVNPLAPEAWDYFCLENLSYHGHLLAINYDKTGAHYGNGKGLRVTADGREIAKCEKLERIVGALPGGGK